LEMECLQNKQMIRMTDLEKYENLIKTEVPRLQPYESRQSVEINAAIITEWLSKAARECTTETPLKKSTNWWNA